MLSTPKRNNLGQEEIFCRQVTINQWFKTDVTHFTTSNNPSFIHWDLGPHTHTWLYKYSTKIYCLRHVQIKKRSCSVTGH